MNIRTIILAVFLIFGLLVPSIAESSYISNTSYPYGQFAYQNRFQSQGLSSPKYSYRYNTYWSGPSNTYSNRAKWNTYNPYNHPLNHFPALNRACYGCGNVFGNPSYQGTSPFGYAYRPLGSPYSLSNVSHFGSPGITPYRSTTSSFGPATVHANSSTSAFQ